MTDAELTLAMAELQEVVRCRCDEAFRDRGLKDPQCECDSAEAVKIVADRIEALTKERERLALAICGGEDLPGYANAQTVETLEKVARDNAKATMAEINRTLAVEAKLAKAVEALRNLHGAVCGETGFAAAVRAVSGKAYPWPRLDQADADAIATLAEIKGESHE